MIPSESYSPLAPLWRLIELEPKNTSCSEITSWQQALLDLRTRRRKGQHGMCSRSQPGVCQSLSWVWFVVCGSQVSLQRPLLRVGRPVWGVVFFLLFCLLFEFEGKRLRWAACVCRMLSDCWLWLAVKVLKKQGNLGLGAVKVWDLKLHAEVQFCCCIKTTENSKEGGSLDFSLPKQLGTCFWQSFQGGAIFLSLMGWWDSEW